MSTIPITQVESKEKLKVTQPAGGVRTSDTGTIALNGEVTQGNSDSISSSSINKRNEIYKKLENICVKYNISIQDIKQSNSIERILGCSTEELSNKTDAEIDRAVKCFEIAVQQLGDKNDIDTITSKAQRYNIALTEGGWTDINKLKNGESLNERISKFTGNNFENLTPEKKKQQIENYYNQTFMTEYNKCSSEQEKKQYLTQQIQDITSLLANSDNPEDIKLFIETTKKVFTDNQIEEYRTILEQYETNTSIKTADIATTENINPDNNIKSDRYAKLEEFCKSQNLNINIEDTIAKILACNTEDLSQKTDAEIEQAIECFETAFEDYNTQGGDINVDSITSKAIRYNLALTEGRWKHIENIRGGDSLSERISKNSGCDFDSLTIEEKEQKIEKYFEGVFTEKYKNAKDQKEKDFLIKQQIQDFTKLLVNTEKAEDRQILMKVIDNLFSKNQLSGLRAVLGSLDAEERTEAVDKYGSEVLQDNPDLFGDYRSSDDNREIAILLSQNASENGAKKLREGQEEAFNEFINENAETLEIIRQKEERIKNGEQVEFTAEEKELIRKRDNYFVSTMAGEAIGYQLNDNLSDNTKNELQTNILSNAKSGFIENEVSTQIKNYINNSNDIDSNTKTSLNSWFKESEYHNYTNSSENSQTSVNTPDNNYNTHTQNYQSNPIENENIQYQKEIQTLVSTKDNKELQTKLNENLKTNPTDKKEFIKHTNNIAIIIKEIIKNGDEAQKQMLLKKLESANTMTVLNVFRTSTAEIQSYFYKNHLISNAAISVNMSDNEKRNLPEEIQAEIGFKKV